MNNIKKIDIHAHATPFPEYYPPYMGGSRMVAAEEVIAFYDKLNIEKGLLLPISSPEAQVTPITSEECKFQSDKYPDRLLWYCNVDPRAMQNSTASDFYSLLNAYKNMGAKGVGEVTSNIYADDPKLDKLFGVCAELDMPVLIHIAVKLGFGYGIVDEIGLPRIEKMLKKHPGLKLIGHSQAFWSEISADLVEGDRGIYPGGKVIPGRIVELMREYPNLYCDLSAGSGANAIMRDEQFGASFLEEFSDRIMYGCDICAPSNTHQFMFAEYFDGMLDKGLISEETYRKVARENALKLFHI